VNFDKIFDHAAAMKGMLTIVIGRPDHIIASLIRFQANDTTIRNAGLLRPWNNQDASIQIIFRLAIIFNQQVFVCYLLRRIIKKKKKVS
jgi:hypothetical protein